MDIDIYGLKKTPQGLLPNNEFLARVELTSTGVLIECYDAILKERLRDIFSNPVIRRVPVGDDQDVFSHMEEAVQPFTEDFFREIVFMLRRWSLHGELHEDRKQTLKSKK